MGKKGLKKTKTATSALNSARAAYSGGSKEVRTVNYIAMLN